MFRSHQHRHKRIKMMSSTPVKTPEQTKWKSYEMPNTPSKDEPISQSQESAAVEKTEAYQPGACWKDAAWQHEVKVMSKSIVNKKWNMSMSNELVKKSEH